MTNSNIQGTYIAISNTTINRIYVQHTLLSINTKTFEGMCIYSIYNVCWGIFNSVNQLKKTLLCKSVTMNWNSN